MRRFIGVLICGLVFIPAARAQYVATEHPSWAYGHGPNLEGVGPVPGIAGRSPSYLVRQLYDMQVGARTGVWAELMKPVVEKLTAEDLVALGAYTASLPPL